MREFRCNGCNAPIIWAQTVDRQRMALDATPIPDGRFKLDETYSPPRVEYAKANDPPGDRFKSHFETCKQKGEA